LLTTLYCTTTIINHHFKSAPQQSRQSDLSLTKPIGKNTQTGYHPNKLISVSLKKIEQPKLTESQKPVGEKTQTGYHPNKLTSVSLENIKQPNLIESHKSIGKNTS
jgi:hypothetical protein